MEPVLEHVASSSAPHLAVSATEFRSIMASFPSGVTVVTTIDADGKPRGTTVSAFISVSADPPMLAVCLAHDSGTLAAIKHTGAFVTHVLAEEGIEVARHFSRPRTDFPHSWSSSRSAAGVPVLQSAVVAVAECSVQAVVPAGDHELVLGLIQDGRHSGGRPMVYHQRQFGGWLGAHDLEFDVQGLAADALGA